MPSKPLTFGLPSDDLKTKLNTAINTDNKERKRTTELPDSELVCKLHAICTENVKDPVEVACIMRRFLTCRFGMKLDIVDQALKEAKVLSDAPAKEMESAA